MAGSTDPTQILFFTLIRCNQVPDQECENAVAHKMKMPEMMKVGHSQKWSESDVRGGGERWWSHGMISTLAVHPFQAPDHWETLASAGIEYQMHPPTNLSLPFSVSLSLSLCTSSSIYIQKVFPVFYGPHQPHCPHHTRMKKDSETALKEGALLL